MNYCLLSFFIFVLLSTCLLVSSVSFLFPNCFCLGEKAEWFFFLFFCFCWGKAGVLFQYFYTMLFLCDEHFRLCAMSTYQAFTHFEEFDWV